MKNLLNKKLLAKSGLKSAVVGFRKILYQRDYNWEFNQLHTYFSYNQNWTPEEIKRNWDKFINTKTINEIFDLYIDIPFCRSKCSYCMYQSWIYKNKKQTDDYIDYLIDEMEFFKKTFQRVKFHRLFIGGGTPNILSKVQFNKLFKYLFKYFSFTNNAIKTIECNPDITTKTQLHLFKQFGFNKINLGVQSLNSKCLSVNKRSYQTLKSVENAIRLSKKEGFEYINVDLIVGLAGDTLDDFAKTFVKVTKLEPATIIVHGLKPLSKKYLSDFLKMSHREYYTKYYPKMIPKAFRIMHSLAEQYGYIHDTLDVARWQWGFRRKDYFGLPDNTGYMGAYSGCNSILGLGIYSRSHILGLAEYLQIKQPQQFSPSGKIFEGKILEKKEEMIKFILIHLDRNSNIPREEFKRLFNRKVIDVFPYALFALRLLGVIRSINEDFIYFSFPKPEDKYIYTLFFFREARLV